MKCQIVHLYEYGIPFHIDGPVEDLVVGDHPEGYPLPLHLLLHASAVLVLDEEYVLLLGIVGYPVEEFVFEHGTGDYPEDAFGHSHAIILIVYTYDVLEDVFQNVWMHN